MKKNKTATPEEIKRATLEEAGYVNMPLEEPVTVFVPVVQPERSRRWKGPETQDEKRTRIAKMYGVPETWVRL